MLALVIAGCLLLSLSVVQEPTWALENGLARTPPMGWLSWARFTCNVDCETDPDDCISSRLYRQMADRLAEDGYRDLGYKYVNIDDCWSELERDPGSGNLVESRERFGEGMSKLAQYVHERDLKLGIYGDCGTKTCAGYPGQLKSEQYLQDNYFELDARRLAEWQVDSFKFDGCNLDPAKAESICPKMAGAIQASGRPMVVICEWPFYMMRERYQLRRSLPVNFTLAKEACNAWRYYEDIEDSWLSVLSVVDFTIQQQLTIVQHHGPGHWFDPDQLVIGNFGLSLDQARAQMALWSVWSVPLYMSNDLRHIDSEMAAVLKNKHLIQVNQDRLGVFGLMVAESDSGRIQAFVKPVEPIRNGCPSYAIVYLNRNTLGHSRFVQFKLRDLLARVPYELATHRYNKMLPLPGGESIIADKCKQLIQIGMTRNPNNSKLLNVPVRYPFAPAPEQPIEERQVSFQVMDLFLDEGTILPVALDGNLTLRVNPSGVRAVKLVQL